MKKAKSILLVVLFTILFYPQTTYASNKLPNKKFNVDTSNYNIESYIENNNYYLFIPEGTDITNLTINYMGDINNISNGTLNEENKTIIGDFSNNNEIDVQDKNNAEYKIIIVKSDLPSMLISLNGVDLQTINKGSKEVKYENNQVILNSSNSKYNFTDSSVQLKGRGNFNWGLSKKPYQIKLSSKTNVLGMGKSKTWLLIANHGDATLMRNKLVYDLAKNIGMPYTQNSEWIDLWVDGEYIGNYLLTEKIQVGTNRVELTDEENGLIAELDNNYYDKEEHYFKTNISNTHFVLKDSEAQDEGLHAFSNFKDYVNNFEKELYKDNKNWNKISSMIDVESFIKFYFMQELTENADGARSSIYIYRDGENDVIHMGPVWDFDLALGNCSNYNWGGNPTYDYITNIKKYMEISNDWYNELFEIPEFRNEVRRIYNDEIKDEISESIQKIDTHQTTLNTSSSMNFIKWKILGKTSAYGSDKRSKYKNTYVEEVNYLKNWMNNRINYLNERYSGESSIIKVKYKTHIQDIGWKEYYSENGEVSGTTGRSLRLEGIKIKLDTFNSDISNNLNIEYQTHIQDIGWQDYVSNGNLSGTTGKAKRLEAIRIKLTGEKANLYDIYYRVHAENFGWMGWARNNEPAGTAGYAYRLEAVEIKIVNKNDDFPEYRKNIAFKDNKPVQSVKLNKKNVELEVGEEEMLLATISPSSVSSKEITWTSDDESIATVDKNGKITAISEGTTLINATSMNGKTATCIVSVSPVVTGVEYRTHVQNIGWQSYKRNGLKSGTEGQSLRLEAININLRNAPFEGSIQYKTHIQNKGWEKDYVSNGTRSGTEGQSLRLEAIEIKLEEGSEMANKYDVYYRVHAQNFGWMGWTKNGEKAGTEGYAYRLEAIEIVLVDKKGGTPPSSTNDSDPFRKN